MSPSGTALWLLALGVVCSAQDKPDQPVIVYYSPAEFDKPTVYSVDDTPSAPVDQLPAGANSTAWLRAARAPPPKQREKLIFAEEFNKLDPEVWGHLVTGWRGGNKEFQYYRNDRRNSYVRGGALFLRPTLTAREYGDAFLYTGKLYYPDCNFEPCVSESGEDIVLPVQSARINTRGAFSFRYGRLEVRAKLPRGDWIWPAIWLKPASNAYGAWPASGEMDLVESRGNANLKHVRTGETQGVQKVGATLHFGPNSSYNIWRLTHWEKILERGDFADAFHVFGMEWSPAGFRFTVDREEIGSMPVPPGGFWDLGGFDKDPGGPNIWANGTELAPFDRKFYIILNVAVGGTFFPNGMVNKPYPRAWNWTSGHPLREFWEHRHWWLPTWKGEHAAMQVDYVRVYQNVP
ncbi:beta-1,3-glucan-binding protein-like [Thrips palmi]|uniref:Beta-1,3-glucan-binding protein-like n=1 Tax=Thrips palmi TaxID=161013 RepID=A0A6P8XWM9_THRPL|nr:beta-1,3-glucan-binding protein-like [Thrips palmi]